MSFWLGFICGYALAIFGIFGLVAFLVIRERRKVKKAASAIVDSLTKE